MPLKLILIGSLLSNYALATEWYQLCEQWVPHIPIERVGAVPSGECKGIGNLLLKSLEGKELTRSERKWLRRHKLTDTTSLFNHFGRRCCRIDPPFSE